MRRAHCCLTRGLTLIEVLATTVLLGLVATTILRSFSAPSAKTQLRALVQQIVALDRRARVMARTGSRVMLAVDPSRERLVAIIRGEGSAIAEVAFASGDSVALRLEAAQPTKTVHFQADGTSCDYAVEMEHADISTRVDIAGLTGWATIAENPR